MPGKRLDSADNTLDVLLFGAVGAGNATYQQALLENPPKQVTYHFPAGWKDFYRFSGFSFPGQPAQPRSIKVFPHTEWVSCPDVDLIHASSRFIVSAIPTVLSMDGYDILSLAWAQSPFHGLVQRIQGLLARSPNVKQLMPQTKWAFKELANRLPYPEEKMTLVHPMARPQPQSIPDNPVPVILFVGNNFERKGGRCLLEAFKGFGEKNRAKLVVAGLMHDAEKIRYEFAGVKNLELRPYVQDRPALLGLYRQADFFCLPTLADAGPYAVLEALSFGLPVISSRMCAIPEMVEEGREGFLTEPGDVPGLRNALEALLADAQKRRRMGRAALEKIQANYSPEAVQPILRRVYAEAVQ